MIRNPGRLEDTRTRPGGDNEDALKYVAIYRDLRGKIATGQYGPGQRLPSQLQLARIYDVTLMTLRQALSELAAEGLVEASHGRGTFVAARPFEYRLNNLSSFAQDMERQGKALSTRILSSGRAEADAAVMAQLALAPGERPHRLERLRLIDGRPVVFQVSYLPAAIGRRLRVKSLESGSLYDVLRTEHGLDVVRALENVKAIGLPQEKAHMLLRSPGSAAFLSTRLSLVKEDRPVLLDEAYMPGDAVEITADRVGDSMRLSFRVR